MSDKKTPPANSQKALDSVNGMVHLKPANESFQNMASLQKSFNNLAQLQQPTQNSQAVTPAAPTNPQQTSDGSK